VSIAYLNDTVRVRVTFFTWNTETNQNDPDDPTSVEVRLYDTSTTPDTLLDTFTPEVTDIYATYLYAWTPDQLGSFDLRFFALFADGSIDVAYNPFTVYETPSEASSTSVPLGEDFVFVFSAGFDPLYVDPEELFGVYPEATGVEIAEQIYIASLEVKDFLERPPQMELTALAIDYVKASAACALSRTYDPVSAGGGALLVSLGDLQVQTGGKSSSLRDLNRGNAGTWCELAALLRKELMRSKTGMRATQRGSVYPNPIPIRRIRRFDR
jgi:hypothetical protein